MKQDVKVFIGNLAYKTTEVKLMSVFQVYGNVVELSFPKDRETGRPRGFAFITYENPDQAKAALQMHDKDLDGRKIRVDFAKPKTSTSQPTQQKTSRFPNHQQKRQNSPFGSNEDDHYDDE